MDTSEIRVNTRATRNFGNRKGRKTEDRFFEAITASSVESLPGRVFGIRRASAKEDSRGIDAVISTDIGKLFIQIKSSEAGASKFKNGRHRRHSLIGIIVIREHHTVEDILKETRIILVQLRQVIIGIRSGIG